MLQSDDNHEPIPYYEAQMEDSQSSPSKAQRPSAKKTNVKGLAKGQAVTIELFARRSDQLTIEHAQNVVGQLGYVPYNLCEVAALSSSGQALVLKLYPLNLNDLSGRYSKSMGQSLPFPTTFWMSCPELHTQISVLEDAGWIQVFQKRMLEGDSSAQYQKAMAAAHECYSAERWGLLSQEDAAVVEENGW